MTVAWDQSPPNVAGYKVFYGYSSRNYSCPVGIINGRDNTRYSIPEELAAYEYYIAATATDGVNESDFSPELVIHSLMATAGAGGLISPAGFFYLGENSNQTFTITSDPGYQIDNVIADGVSVGPVANYTFSNIAAAHTITAFFKAAPTIYAIMANAGTNGAISPSGSVSVSSGGNQRFTITPNAGYQISKVTVDGMSVGAVTSYSFSNVTASHTISATFVALDTDGDGFFDRDELAMGSDPNNAASTPVKVNWTDQNTIVIPGYFNLNRLQTDKAKDIAVKTAAGYVLIAFAANSYKTWDIILSVLATQHIIRSLLIMTAMGSLTLL